MQHIFQPCAVIIHMRDGTVIEEVYPTRFQAELFLYLLPMLMATQPHDRQAAAAILSPLVEEPAPAPNRRYDHLRQ